MIPYSTQAEQSVIGAVMADPSALDRISLDAADFFEPRHAEIFTAQKALAAKGQSADPLTLWERLGGSHGGADLPYLTACEHSVPSARNVERHAAVVSAKAAQRRLIAAADQALEIAREPGDGLDRLDRIETLFGALARQQSAQAPQRLGDLALSRTAHYEAIERGEVEAGWPTGARSIDQMLTGGLRKKWVYILAARPSVGKSSLAQSIGLRQAADGRPTLFLSQEMASVELVDRAVAHAGRIDSRRLLSGNLGDEGWGRVADGVDSLSSLPYYVDDQPALRLLDIRSKARAVKGLKVLIIDYIQLCEGAGAGNRNGDIEEISRGIKRLAKEMDIPVILLSQLSREVEKRATKRPVLSDLRDSGAIEQDADVVMMLWPVRDLDGGRRLVGCGIEKNRHGPVGAVGLDFDGATQRWHESNEDIHAKQGAPRGFE